MTWNSVLYATINLLAASACFSDRVLQAQDETPKTVSFCKLTSHPEKYRGNRVTLRITVNLGRHATLISDRACPKQTLFLLADQAAVQTHAVAHFYQFLAEPRLSSKPIFATITGRLVSGSERGFVLKRDYDFALDSVSEISEGNQSKHL